MASFVLDTNVVTAILKRQPAVIRRFRQELEQGSCLLLSRVVDYELRRGLAHKPRKEVEERYGKLKEVLGLSEVHAADWEWAIEGYARARQKGHTPSDPDLLIAAQAARMDAVVVSWDRDFDCLDVERDTWG